MSVKIALAGNPNCGKTTLFNALTGSNQFVGNWPGVTVEKKEGKLKGHTDVVVVDLPGIYSLSPYTLEEVVARNYIIDEKPNVIINIVDGTNLERNLYLTTQIMELGIPVIMAVNMMDIIEKNGDKIDIASLRNNIGCEVVEISALKGTGITKVAEKAVGIAGQAVTNKLSHNFDKNVEEVIDSVEEKLGVFIREEQKRFFAIKLLERDSEICAKLKNVPNVDSEIEKIEEMFDDDVESVITNERYQYITSIIGKCVKKKDKSGKLSISDRIDRIVTNRILALPIFAVVMYLVYYIAMVTVGVNATDWANDSLFGDGFHLFGNGTAEYEEASEEYNTAKNVLDAYGVLVVDEEDVVDIDATLNAAAKVKESDNITYKVTDEETLAEYDVSVYYSKVPEEVEEDEALGMSFLEAVKYAKESNMEEPEAASYGIYIPSVPDVVTNGLEKIGCAEWVKGLIVDGIVAGVGAVLGFVPQMLVLFFLLAFLETCGYMARIAFIMDRIFRRFGLSGKSFIPMLVGTGCGVPGIMASRTIENDRDRKITIMTTTFIPCGAKTPFIAMIAGAIFGGSAWVATSAYFIGIAAVVCSGIILKKIKAFEGDPAPFVMELPSYHMPTIESLLRSMWERGWSFIKKAGTIILLSTILVWFTSFYGVVDGTFRMLSEDEMSYSILATIGKGVSWIFVPQGWGNWQAAVASITGLVAKENIVGTMGILYGATDSTVYQNINTAFSATNGIAFASGLSFMIFNLLCAPCFAAMGAIKREMNNIRWFWAAIGYQCGLAYGVSLCVYRIGGIFTGECRFGLWTVVAFGLLAGFIFLLFRPVRQRRMREVGNKVTA